MTSLSRPSLPRLSAGGPRKASAALATALSAVAGSLLTPRRLAEGRVGMGVVMLATPATAPRLLGVDQETAERTTWATQMLGARELALGAGTWVALGRGDRRAARVWLAASLAADALDALVMAGAVGRGKVRPAGGAATVAVATTAVAVQAAALTERD